MQKYNSYKPTNIEWLGDVPSHWKVDTLKNHCDIFASNVDKKTEEGEIEVSLCNYVDVYKNNVINTSIDFMKATATEAEIEKFTLQLNDIIVTKDSETPDDIAVPSIVKEPFKNFLCGYHLSIIRCIRQIEPDFLIWALRDLSIATQFHREAVGITRYGLASKHFKNGIIAFPDKREQMIIANFLNDATSKIDSLISYKVTPENKSNGQTDNFYSKLNGAKSIFEKQIVCLQQYRKSLIHECITGKRKVTE